jgi:hypothetical protein
LSILFSIEPFFFDVSYIYERKSRLCLLTSQKSSIDSFFLISAISMSVFSSVMIFSMFYLNDQVRHIVCAYLYQCSKMFVTKVLWFIIVIYVKNKTNIDISFVCIYVIIIWWNQLIMMSNRLEKMRTLCIKKCTIVKSTFFIHVLITKRLQWE